MHLDFRKFGVGPGFVALSLIFAAVVLLIQYGWLENPTFTLGSRWVNLTLGGVWTLVGLLVFGASVAQFRQYYRRGTLCTRGVYALMRHPMYGAWIVFIVPGVVVALGSVCGLTVPVWMAGVFRRLIGKEERWLEAHFGEAYREYRRRVGMLGPRLFRR